MSRPEKQSIAVVIRNPEKPETLLTVMRPTTDADLPNVWGLPAVTLRPGEDWEGAIKRLGMEKLGVPLRAGPQLKSGSQERRDYKLTMRVYEAEIEKGRPFVPQPDDSVTQYKQWKWGVADDLKLAAQRGSLCCKLFLE